MPKILTAREYDKQHYFSILKIFGDAVKILSLNEADSIAIATFSIETTHEIDDLQESKEWLDGEKGLARYKKWLNLKVHLLISES